MADKDGGKRTLSAQISQWEQPKLFSRHFQDSKYVGEKNTFFGGWWSDFSTKLNDLQTFSSSWTVLGHAAKINKKKAILTLTVLVTTIDAQWHFETG